MRLLGFTVYHIFWFTDLHYHLLSFFQCMFFFFSTVSNLSSFLFPSLLLDYIQTQPAWSRPSIPRLDSERWYQEIMAAGEPSNTCPPPLPAKCLSSRKPMQVNFPHPSVLSACFLLSVSKFFVFSVYIKWHAKLSSVWGSFLLSVAGCNVLHCNGKVLLCLSWCFLSCHFFQISKQDGEVGQTNGTFTPPPYSTTSSGRNTPTKVRKWNQSAL